MDGEGGNARDVRHERFNTLSREHGKLLSAELRLLLSVGCPCIIKFYGVIQSRQEVNQRPWPCEGFDAFWGPRGNTLQPKYARFKGSPVRKTNRTRPQVTALHVSCLAVQSFVFSGTTKVSALDGHRTPRRETVEHPREHVRLSEASGLRHRLAARREDQRCHGRVSLHATGERAA
ncbi:unnamed protein product [Ectocarpus sp. 12 AP-2014]